MRRKIVLRQSNRYVPLGVFLLLIGTAALVAFAPGLPGSDPMAWVLVPVVCGAFMALGVAMIVKTIKEKVTVYPYGLSKDSAPYGERTFQCNWDEVMDYSWTSRTRFIEMGADATTYVLTAPKGQLRFNTNDSYFARLHSFILSRLPESAEVHLQKSETPLALPIEDVRYYRRTSFAGNAAQFILMLIFAAAGLFMIIVPWVSNPTTPMPFMGKVLIVLMGGLFLYIGGSRMIGAMRRRSTDTVRVSTDGITAFWGGKRGVHIPWDELKAVQYLFYIDRHDDDEDSRNTIRIRSGPRYVYYYALIGTEGKCIWFNSRMRDFEPFRTALRDHAQLHTAISLH